MKFGRNKSDFRERVLNIVKNIKRGETLTYGEVAKIAGNVKSAREVGNIMKQNYNPNIPCHRVIRADGRVGGYNRGGQIIKQQLLNKEATSNI